MYWIVLTINERHDWKIRNYYLVLWVTRLLSRESCSKYIAYVTKWFSPHFFVTIKNRYKRIVLRLPSYWDSWSWRSWGSGYGCWTASTPDLGQDHPPCRRSYCWHGNKSSNVKFRPFARLYNNIQCYSFARMKTLTRTTFDSTVEFQYDRGRGRTKKEKWLQIR